MTNREQPARSDTDWSCAGETPCDCGKCLVCEVEALAGPVESETAKPMLRVIIRRDPEPKWSSTGVAFRAFYDDGAPLYLGAETREALVAKVASDFSHKLCVFEDAA